MATADSPQTIKDVKEKSASATPDGTALSTAVNHAPDALKLASDKFTRGPMPEQIANIYQVTESNPSSPAVAVPLDKAHKQDAIQKLLDADQTNSDHHYQGDGGLRHGTKDSNPQPGPSDNHNKPPVDNRTDAIGTMIESWSDGKGTTITNKDGTGSIKLLTGDERHFGTAPQDNFIQSASGAITQLSESAVKAKDAVVEGWQNLSKGLDVLARNAPVDAKAVEDSVDAIHNARGIFTTDGGAISKALNHKTEADLRAIQARYKEKYGTPLRDELKHDFDLPLVGDVFGKGEKAEALLDHRDPVSLATERTHIDDAAKSKLSTADYDHFHKQMAAFEERSSKEHISNEEVARTYREVSKILETKGDKPLQSDERDKIAMQVMDNAANPNRISQGSNNTCNVTTLETTIYRKDPSEAARMVGDISRTGIYVDRNGTVLKSNPEARTNAADVYPNPDGTRSHASEIFQIAAVNLSYQERGINRTYDQTKIPPPQNATDNGERLYDISKTPPVEALNNDGKPARAPGLTIGNLVDLHKGITGKDSLEAIQSDSYFGPHDAHETNITSEQQLNDKLAEAKKNGKFPMIVGVNSLNEPLWTDSGGGAAGGSGGAHVFTVTDYTPGPPPKVNIENEWGKSANYQGDKMMSTHDLFTVMQPTSFARQQDQNEVDQARKEGRVDFKKEIDLMRLEHSDGNKISGTDFQKQHEDLTDRMIADVQKRGTAVTPAEKKDISDKLAAAGSGMTVEAQLASITKIHDAKISNTFDYDSSLAYLGHRIALEKKKIDNGDMPASARAAYEAKAAIYKEYVSKLPKEDQNFITYNLKNWGDDK
ncbi:MAG: hypothetical protein P4L53_23550 [Candidatus Obscuribacterales bacterium]|nr:hypothetical protein [Candidatus Obscuribacterales bacterium]